MTKRARTYLTIGMFRHLILGLAVVLVPGMFRSSAYVPVITSVEALPGLRGHSLDFWGVLMLVTALLLAVAVVTRQVAWARAGLAASIVITAAIGAGVTLGVGAVWWEVSQAAISHGMPWWQPIAAPLPGQDPVPSIVIPVLLLTLAGKDGVAVRQPLDAPFEALVRRIEGSR